MCRWIRCCVLVLKQGLLASLLVCMCSLCVPSLSWASAPAPRVPSRQPSKRVPFYTQDPVLTILPAFLTTPPGVTTRPYMLSLRMARAFYEKGKSYKPRTHHFRTDGLPSFTNRLIFETSPYLLQHAHNPVNWQPWGKAAFAKAKREKKPVLLSVGYSTCHWCHVMERESFENKRVAAYMNKHYVAIKVDREERTDVDGIYMSVVQMLTGSGGWPMTVWLTPERQPFHGGTYFPPRSRWRRKGFLTVLKEQRTAFNQRPARVASRAKWLVRRLQRSSSVPASSGVPGRKTLYQAATLFSRNFDPTHGGRRGRPKFPSSWSPTFMLRYFRRTGDQKAKDMAALTLQKMARGGIYDQVAGGFHRYSVDQRWLVPHFEKMLYDNALLVPAYLDAYQVTKRPEFARIAREVLDYVTREMRTREGGFYSATDADSEGHEGKFFVWTPAELQQALGTTLSHKVKAFYGVTPRGNFEGKNILNIPVAPKHVAKRLKTTMAKLWPEIQRARQILYKVRKKRIPPLCDTKIITSWNALMISAFARAGLVLQEARYTAVAAKAARFLLHKVRNEQGRLFRTYKDGRARHNAYLEDYAFLTAALLDVYEATQDLFFLREAMALQRVLQAFYRDATHGGYFRTSRDHERLLVRPKPRYDGAVPTGNSIQVMNLLRLHEITTQARFRKLAEQTFKAFGDRLRRYPVALSEMVLALDFYYDAPKQIVLVKPKPSSSVEPFLRVLRRQYLPNRVLVIVTQGQTKAVETLIPWVAKKKAIKGQVTVYVCMRQVCELPTRSPTVFAAQLRKKATLKFPPL